MRFDIDEVMNLAKMQDGCSEWKSAKQFHKKMENHLKSIPNGYSLDVDGLLTALEAEYETQGFYNGFLAGIQLVTSSRQFGVEVE